MTQIEVYSAKCLECGYVMPIKFQLLSYNTMLPQPQDLDLSNHCETCGSSNIQEIPRVSVIELSKESKGNDNP